MEEEEGEEMVEEATVEEALGAKEEDLVSGKKALSGLEAVVVVVVVVTALLPRLTLEWEDSDREVYLEVEGLEVEGW